MRLAKGAGRQPSRRATYREDVADEDWQQRCEEELCPLEEGQGGVAEVGDVDVLGARKQVERVAEPETDPVAARRGSVIGIESSAGTSNSRRRTKGRQLTCA